MKNLHIKFAGIDFECPFCNKKYIDDNEKFYKRIEKNKKGYTTTNCQCGEKFGIAADMTGKLVGFKL